MERAGKGSGEEMWEDELGADDVCMRGLKSN